MFWIGFAVGVFVGVTVCAFFLTALHLAKQDDISRGYPDPELSEAPPLFDPDGWQHQPRARGDFHHDRAYR